jgi:hypothetical protein
MFSGASASIPCMYWRVRGLLDKAMAVRATKARQPARNLRWHVEVRLDAKGVDLVSSRKVSVNCNFSNIGQKLDVSTIR